MSTSLYRLTGLKLCLIPIRTRVPLKFGPETLTSVTCLRVGLSVVDANGRCAEGWGEMPLSVQWVWPSERPYGARLETLQRFCREIALAWMDFPAKGHALEVGYDFQEQVLPELFSRFNQNLTSEPPRSDATHLSRISKTSELGNRLGRGASSEAMPWLAALVCNSAFDLALHDAFGRLAERPVYETYGPELLNRDLSSYLEPAPGARQLSFAGRYPQDYLVKEPMPQLIAWHLVGGLDAVEPSELTGAEPDDGYPTLLSDWIKRDGLKCLKIKLRGNDERWDYQRLLAVAGVGLPLGVEWLSADFNCTVKDPEYVNRILDLLRQNFPKIYDCLLYVEQPFPYDLEHNQIDVHSVSERKPLFLDESAHDWRLIRLGRKLGWTGVALKTCKTQTGALLSACWARAHGMSLMVQDLTNPMLAQIPHLLLAARVGTIMGVETNSMQFYPAASAPEAKVHPGLYQRRQGKVDLSSIHGPGFGYRLEEIQRDLPEPDLVLNR
ncbi:MAG TPA: enolase C-terminal domain-like protein [Verrucomicrobiae bacterium]|nr:enolase C-terminal domain-like protein [Verrucomicrobiae bacterium]